MDTPRKPGRPKGALNKKQPVAVVESAPIAEVVEADTPPPVPTPVADPAPITPPAPTPRSIIPPIEEEESDASSEPPPQKKRVRKVCVRN